MLSVFSEDYFLGNCHISDSELEDWFGPDFVFGTSTLLIAMPHSYWTNFTAYFMTTRIVNGRASHAVYKVNKLDGAFLSSSKVCGSDIPKVCQFVKKFVSMNLKRIVSSVKED